MFLTSPAQRVSNNNALANTTDKSTCLKICSKLFILNGYECILPPFYVLVEKHLLYWKISIHITDDTWNLKTDEIHNHVPCVSRSVNRLDEVLDQM